MLSGLQMLSTTAAASSSGIGVGKPECGGGGGISGEVNSNVVENSVCPHEHVMNCEKAPLTPLDRGGGANPASSASDAAAAAVEIDRLKREKVGAFHEIERYKRVVTYALVFSLLSFAAAVLVVAWRLTPAEPTFEEMRERVIRTPTEEPRLCVTVFPESIARRFDPAEVGEPLLLTPYVEAGRLEEAAAAARVAHVMQTEESYSGFLTVNKELNSNLFFWYFPSRAVAEKRAEDIPLVLWLQGGPGWPTMYGLFKENGPYLVGWDAERGKTFLVRNKFSWTRDHHMLYIDNPVGAGFSFTEDMSGYPRTDSEVAEGLLSAIVQFMKLYPFMTRGRPAANATRFFAFGESYGGSYVVSLANKFLEKRAADREFARDLNFAGIGIGNGMISGPDQSLYADYFNSLGYVDRKQYEMLKALDEQVVKTSVEGNYSATILHSQASLHIFATDIMDLTNIYDFTFDDNYLTNHEYVCFLQKEQVRRGIHAGGATFHKGHDSYTYLNESVMVSKKEWLNGILEDGSIEVLIYNGNLDVIVHVPGMNRVVNSLDWKGKEEFNRDGRKKFWTWNDDQRKVQVVGD